MPKFPIRVYIGTQYKTIANAGAFRWLCSAYKYIQAAGGIVINEQDEVLMILRRGKWDFAKGKVEEGEALTDAALREVQEETGISAQIANDSPYSTFHCYDTYGENMIKETFWFLMSANSEQPLTPQKEENIEKVEWVPVHKVGELLQDSYGTLNEVWQHYAQIL
ncbi:MAG: NUDIX domain-containing protein [Bacteroidales bacterium]|nr:NUDIX domain-containing protein [Bacteroidales bacterium]